MKKAPAILLIICFCILSVMMASCQSKDNAMEVPFYRKVAREECKDGWVFTFVYNGIKDADADDSDTIHYQFYGVNLRYRYDAAFVQQETHKSENGRLATYQVIPPVLVWGTGSEAQARDMLLVNEILDNSRTPEEILSLREEDYSFEELDGQMFFHLVRQALTGDAQKEGTSQLYWDKPVYAFLEEPIYMDGYKFQIAFMHETGCVDELFIDILYQTGDGYSDYTQLSDLVEDGTASAEQRHIFESICDISERIKDSESFLCGSEENGYAQIESVDFKRLFTFLRHIHNNEFSNYVKDSIIQLIED